MNQGEQRSRPDKLIWSSTWTEARRGGDRTATPTTQEMKPRVLVLGETPGALAVLPAGTFQEPLELFDELLHGAATTSMAAATAAALAA